MNEFEKYIELCDLIGCAVEEARSVEHRKPREITVAVSPDCETVLCTLTGRWDIAPDDSWAVYRGLNVDEILDKVWYNFNLNK